MFVFRSHEIALSALFLGLVPGLPASAQASPQATTQASGEIAAGFSLFRLMPSAGEAQSLNGFFLTGRIPLKGAWSLEADLRTGVGTDLDGVRLRQWTGLVGPRYTWGLSREVDIYAHLLGGVGSLGATQAQETIRSTRAALAPGLGLDYHFSPRFALRGQVDSVLTQYGDHRQRNLCLSLGVAFRGGQKPPLPAAAPAPVIVEAPPKVVMAMPAPAPVVELPRPAVIATPAAKIVLDEPVLHFANGQAAPTPESLRAIRGMATGLKGCPGAYSLVVRGYASSEGKPAWNRTLSQRRAHCVAKTLEDAGIPASAIQAEGKGIEHPAASNGTRKGRALNRRVEIEVKTSGGDVEIRKMTTKAV